MIYATDLDRTLIYSDRFIKDNHEENVERTLVDESKVNSYISNEVLKSLKELCKHRELRFIPVTTRSLAEYKRIYIPDVIPEYAITSNGGTILYKGIILKEWKRFVFEHIRGNELQDIIRDLNSIKCIDYRSKIIDESYVFSKTSNPEGLAKSIEWITFRLKYSRYNIKLYRNKIYVIPKIIGKDTALNWIKQYLSEDKIIASGDSSFDVPMLETADVAIVPGHNSIDSSELERIGAIVASKGINSPLQTFQEIKSRL